MKRILHFMKTNKLWGVLLIPLGLALTMLASCFPGAVERYYSSMIYPFFVRTFGTVTSLVPFSLSEILLAIVIILASIFVVLVPILLIKRRLSRKTLIKIACRLAVTLSVIYFIFVLFCGLNYHRYEFADTSGLTIAKAPVSKLVALCEELAATANAQRAAVLADDNGIMQLKQSNTAKDAQVVFDELSDKGYPLIFKARIVPKPVIATKIMAGFNIAGIFSPFMIEANVNGGIPDYNIPATMCHELAHTRGFMREDEANFIGYLACRESNNPDFNYSGTMLALVHSMNLLSTVDYDEFSRIAQSYSEGVRTDLNANSAYWKQFQGIAADLSEKANDTYLKANSQDDGVMGYGRMVDLLIADFDKRNE